MKKIMMRLCVLGLLTALTVAEEPQNSISGLVLDQNNNPVSGATVRAVTKEQGASIRADEILTTQTDPEGNFSFLNASGDIKITTVKKSGYVCVKDQLDKANDMAFQLSTASSSLGSQPILIRMHKKAADPVFLRKTTSQFNIKSGGTENVYLDMQSGRKKIGTVTY